MNPRLQILGEATSEEVAAVVTALASITPPQTAKRGPTPVWASPHRQFRPQLGLHLGGWRDSARPR